MSSTAEAKRHQTRKRQTGFRRGFLLAQNKPSSKKLPLKTSSSTRKATSSSGDLLLFEQEQSNKTPLLVVSSTPDESSEQDSLDHEPATGPLNLLLHDDSSDCFQIKEISTTRIERKSGFHSPVQDTGERKNNNTVGSQNAKHLQEQSTPLQEANPMLIEIDNIPNGPNRMEAASQVPEIETISTLPAAGASVPEESLDDLSMLRSELSGVLWHLKRHSKRGKSQKDIASPSIVKEFLAKHLRSESHCIHVWDSILEACAQNCRSSEYSPEVQLGIFMMQEHPEGLATIVLFLAPSHDKRPRVLSLGAVLVIRSWLEMSSQINQTHMIALLHLVTPKLSNIVLESAANKRTVLSHWCMMTIYEIVTIVSKEACRENNSRLLRAVWEQASMLEKIWEVQQNRLGNSSSPSVDKESSSSTTDGDGARKSCTIAALVDWRRLFKHCNLEYQDVLSDDRTKDREDVGLQVVHYFCGQISGVIVRGVDHVSMGSLAQTLCADYAKVTPEDILTALEAAVSLMQLSREESTKENSSSEAIEYKQRAILRGVVGWLGQSKKRLQMLSKASASPSNDATTIDSTSDSPCSRDTVSRPLQHAVELSMKLLRCQSADCTDLVLAILNHLWSDSGGLPPDLFERHTDETDSMEATDSIPSSFLMMTEELKRMASAYEENDNSEDGVLLDPSTKALCMIISRCILRKGKCLLSVLVSRNGICASTVEVLAMILLAGDSYTEESSTDTVGGTPCHEAGKILLEHVQSCVCVRQKIQQTPQLFCCLPIELTVPKLVEALQSEDTTCSVVTTSLTNIMETKLGEVDKLIPLVVGTLLRVNEIVDSSSKSRVGYTSLDPAGKLCSKFAGSWRRCLLVSSTCGDHGFANVLVAIGKSMFTHPSKTVPLTLLGGVLGDAGDDVLSGIEGRRVHFAAVALLKLCLNEMQTSDLAVADASNGSEKEDPRLFRQLSPLLLLRRIPSTYFSLAFQTDVISKCDHDVFALLLGDLCNDLAARLDIAVEGKLEKRACSAEERRLSAEIAGHCLPFYLRSTPGEPLSPSCYDRICVPAFRSALQVLRNEQLNSTTAQESRVSVIRRARAALYAACHHVPLANDEDEGEGILGTASFAFQVLNLETHVDSTQPALGDDEDVIQLQTGCIDFFAICLESTLQRQREHGSGQSKHFVAEIASSGSAVGPAIGNSVDKPKTNLQVLNLVSGTLVTVLRSGVSASNWMAGGGDDLDSDSVLNESESVVSFSPSARTCLWNSVLVTSQRISEQNGKLENWAQTTLPWIIDWGSGGKVDLNLRHPLCMAAALQVTFVLITRTKGFDCLTARSSEKENQHVGIRRAYRWAVESVKCNFKGGGEYAGGAMRMAGLKLMLAIVSIDQVITTDESAWQGCLSPGELGETYSVLRGAANMDADRDVRKLATHILGSMQQAR